MKPDTLRFYIDCICDQTAWSSWQPLEGSWLGNRLPRSSGIYRIRLAEAPDLLYVGETGKKEETLKTRIRALREVYNPEQMPYRSPHTAGPHLWALRKKTQVPFEVSTISLGPDKTALRKRGKMQVGKEVEELLQEEVEEPVRKGLEQLVIALHRQQFGRSPAAQHGRMLAEWRASSSNTAALAARGLRYRGYQTSVLDESHVPGIPPLVPLAAAGAPTSLQWGGHDWSVWCHPSFAQPPKDAVGFYRIRYPDATQLLYIGRGRIADRLKEYSLKSVECSWVQGLWMEHQLLELLADMIASYLLTHSSLPSAQFGSSKRDRLIRMGQSTLPERVWWRVIVEDFWRELLPTAS